MNPAGGMLLRGVDVAAFATALVIRLRRCGVGVSAVGGANFSRALTAAAPHTRTQLYWAARITLISRHEDLDAFDTQFSAVFDNATLPLDPPARRAAAHNVAERSKAVTPGSGADDNPLPRAKTLPWINRVPAGEKSGAPDHRRSGRMLPSPLAGKSEQSFAQLSAPDLELLGRWIEQAEQNWPKRRRRRRMASTSGRVDLRKSMASVRRTGFELIHLARTRPRQRPRTIVVLCDVSRSMHGYADIYLHLMRVAARRGDAEVFAFSTTLTRLTPILAHRSADAAIEKANACVADRYGGTHIGSSIAALLTSHHGQALRGAVVVIASDGWDSDDPRVLAHAMARVRRRAHRVVWLNPRVGADGFQPLTGSMAAALPYCDSLLPADNLTALHALFDTISDAVTPGVSDAVS